MTAYVAARGLPDALELLARHQDEAKVLAGGQSLLVLLRQGLIAPSVLVSLRAIEELRAVAVSAADGGHIGAGVTQARLEREEHLRAHYTALVDAASVVATRQVRNRGTLGGNLCHADPTADPPAALIALGAALELVGLSGTRQVPVEAFFRDFMEVDVGPQEILTRVLLPPAAPDSGSAYLKHRLREVDTALVGAAVWVRLDPAAETIAEARVGLAAAGPTPLRSLAAEDVLRGAPASAETLAAAGRAAAAASMPLSDTEASEWYRREMVSVFVQRAARLALARAGGRPA